MVVALLGVVLVLGGLYVLTRDAVLWQQIQAFFGQIAGVMSPAAWQRVEYFAAIGALVTGAVLILLRLFGGLRRV